MDHAWLDSLSEDWVSQPRSSGSPAPSLPSLSNSMTDSSNAGVKCSRIPRFDPERQLWTTPKDDPLSERSLNNHNIPHGQRNTNLQSKLREEVVSDVRGRLPSRSFSASTTSSTNFGTVAHKSVSVSPRRTEYETPEWKRRLLQGEVAYGEQRDLFSPAGLENIFRPPALQDLQDDILTPRKEQEDHSIMPSSPPPYDQAKFKDYMAQERSTPSTENLELQPERAPRTVAYRQMDNSNFDISANSVDERMCNELSEHAASDPNAQPVKNVLSETQSLSEGMRTASGQSELRHEEFSPVYVPSQASLSERMAQYSIPRSTSLSRNEPGPSSDQVSRDRLLSDSSGDVRLMEKSANSLDARFVNLRRGGYSQEGSFQKRLLSLSSLPGFDESAMLPEESIQASTPKTFLNINRSQAPPKESSHLHTDQSSPSVNEPVTPHVSPKKSDQKPNGGSPLKLFGNYDTFTNQKLLRRLSQFEINNVQRQNGENSQVLNSHERSRQMGNFGNGDFDKFEFSEERSYDSSDLVDPDETNPYPSTHGLTKQNSFKFQLDPSANTDLQRPANNESMHKPFSGTGSEHRTNANHIVHQRKETSSMVQTTYTNHAMDDQLTPRKCEGGSDGKRLPKSPLKDSTPKRRRTLQKSDFVERGEAEREHEKSGPLINEAHLQMQSIIGRKRKDARPGNNLQAANPQVLAKRQILRPRTPTPSQRTMPLQEHRWGDPSHSASRTAQMKRIAEVQAELDAPGGPLASQVLAVTQQMQSETRKGSVTTQDFLNEAKMIMAGIRGKARSGLASLEESESENDRNISPEGALPDPTFEDSHQESTREPFSRPPSREGKPFVNIRREQDDPVLLDHLRKYQEQSELDLAIASSVKSYTMSNKIMEMVQGQERPENVANNRSTRLPRSANEFGTLHSDPPNIMISENPDLQRKRKHSTSSVPTTEDLLHGDYLSHNSNSSSGQSTARSIPTGSSRGSDSRRVIAPHTVSHLIPEQLAGMYLDKEKNIWIKRKTIDTLEPRTNFLPSDESEEDPFGDIPDLSVDETQEMRRLKAIAAKNMEESPVAIFEALTKTDSPGDVARDAVECGTPLTNMAGHPDGNNALSVSSTTRMTPTHAHLGASTLQHASKVTINSSQTTTTEQTIHQVSDEPGKGRDIDVDAEISIMQDRVATPPTQQRRNVTISFSSPVAQIISSTSFNNQSGAVEVNYRNTHNSQQHLHHGIPSHTDKNVANKSHNSALRSALRNGSRRISLGGPMLMKRPVSRIEEHDENVAQAQKLDARSCSISIIATTPLPAKRETSLIIATPQQAEHIGNLSLTPLSEFTVNQVDRSFGMDISYVEAGNRQVMGATGKRTLSLSIKQLVEKITQVEPYEPFWEHLQQLDLKDKRLTTLHKLDEFCEHLVELDASRNEISQLDGVPSSVRELRISHNQISDLAAWGQLHNLQYIDVSDNQIESLAGFRNLHHLRGLRADNNKIKSLDGVLQLSGLIQLRLRGNEIESLEFAGSNLQRLTDLDLRDNKISVVRNVQELRCLSSLNLEDNDLSEFIVSRPIRALRYLKLSSNNLERMDVSGFPDLRLLYVDDNRLESVKGLLKTKYLDTLSMREQQDGTYIDPSFLSQALEIRKLFLSGNLLTTFQPQVEYLNLQYLELANCGIETLSPEFGYMIPNVRVLNLNFNALRDIRPLAGISRLKRLHLAGNRLLRLRSTTSLISQMPTLSLVDLRNNPFTQGFYPSAAECRTIVRETEVGDESSGQAFLLKPASREDDVKYVRRLDQQTKIMRRLFEIMVLNGCNHLKTLDGLAVDRDVLVAKDDVWQDLIAAGILKTDAHSGLEQGEEQSSGTPIVIRGGKPVLSEHQEDTRVSGRWQAEDSFA